MFVQSCRSVAPSSCPTMKRHSAGSTGVIDSRLPRARTRMFSSSGGCAIRANPPAGSCARSPRPTAASAGCRAWIGVEVLARRVELGGVRVGLLATRAMPAIRLGAAGSGEQHKAVAHPHGVAHEVAGLVVCTPYQGNCLARTGRPGRRWRRRRVRISSASSAWRPRRVGRWAEARAEAGVVAQKTRRSYASRPAKNSAPGEPLSSRHPGTRSGCPAGIPQPRAHRHALP